MYSRFRGRISFLLIVHLTSLAIGGGALEEGHEGPQATTYVAKLSKRYGYPMEKHKVVTDDGHILTLYLIPQPGESKYTSKTVLLSHGLLVNSNCWFINERQVILPFKLHDQGYNVMLGNFRGTTLSLRHRTLSTNSSQYWDFSFDELGRYDMAAMIDYTLETMKQEKLFLIGHSMGTTTGFVLLSERPEYNNKLYRFIALAPSVFQFSSKSLFRRYISPFLNVQRYQRAFTSHHYLRNGIFPPFYPQIEQWRQNCAKAIIGKTPENSTFKERNRAYLCKQVILAIGVNTDKLAQEAFETLLSVPIEVSSVRTVVHYVQTMNARHFRRYDYGRLKNLAKYNSPTPPDYDLSKVTCPISIYWGLNDDFAAKQDVKALIQQLPSSSGLNEVYEVSDPTWDHFDYILSTSAQVHINPYILESLKYINASDHCSEKEQIICHNNIQKRKVV